MFRDIILVSATDAGKSRQADVRTSDAGAITLLGQVRVWAAEIRERRARKVEMIVRRLARLTMHQLARGAMKSAEARILKEWEADCAWLIEGMSSAHDDLPIVLNELLRRFARSLEQARPGSIERHSGSTRIDAPRTRAPQQGATGAQVCQADCRRPYRAVAHRARAFRPARPHLVPRLRRRARRLVAISPGSTSGSRRWKACWRLAATATP
ncbi:MAG: hypothetical protein WDN31_03905 [Hyphomicrobium sp.]